MLKVCYWITFQKIILVEYQSLKKIKKMRLVVKIKLFYYIDRSGDPKFNTLSKAGIFL